jgi:hypothetical protein
MGAHDRCLDMEWRVYMCVERERTSSSFGGTGGGGCDFSSSSSEVMEARRVVCSAIRY